MDHFPLMHILDALDELVDVVASLNLMQAFAPLDQVGKRLVLTDVQHNIHILFIFEVAIEAHDILVVQRPVDLNLARELLSRLCPGKIGLRDTFESPSGRLMLFSLDRLNPFHLVALGETTFSKEAAPAVFHDLAWLVMILRIYRFDFLLDCLQRCEKKNKVRIKLKTR